MKKGKMSYAVMYLYLVGTVGLAGCSAMTGNDLETSPPGIVEPESTAIEEISFGEGDASETEIPKSEEIFIPDRKWTSELKSLMEKINEEHKAVKKVEGDYSRYVEQEPKGYLNLVPYMADSSEESKFDGAEEYSIEQVQEDLDLLMLALQTNYGPFYYYGGREKFLRLKEEIIRECSETKELNGEFLLNCLLDKLSFIQDAHFNIQNEHLSDYQVPIFYREVAFKKSEIGYQPLAEDEKTVQLRTVESVEGWENLDNLFKRSLSENGEIVYYPVVYQAIDPQVIKGTRMEEQPETEALTIHYSDGSTQILNANLYEPYLEEESEIIACHENQGVPVIFARNMYNSEPKSDVFGKKFINYAEKYRNVPVMIIDLRANSGGDISCPAKWWETYTEHEVTANFVFMMKGSFQDRMSRARDANSDYYLSIKTMKETLGYRGISDYYTAGYSQQDRFVDNEELLIVLTSKRTASAAEHFTEIAHNVENTLIIGENSTGAMFGSGSGGWFELPNTHLRLSFGISYSILPENPAYFQEYRGLEPDIWVPAGEAEELAVKFIERYMHAE